MAPFGFHLRAELFSLRLKQFCARARSCSCQTSRIIRCAISTKNSPTAKGRRIAVIGAGVAGLSAAWLLSRRHHVTLYEKNGWLGGHANTVDVDCPEGTVPVDTGFIVYNPVNYPNFTALLEPSRCPDRQVGHVVRRLDRRTAASEYSSTALGLFGQPRNLVSPRYWQMIGDILKFYRARARPRRSAGRGSALASSSSASAIAGAVVDEHVLPMCAAIWSTTPQRDARLPDALVPAVLHKPRSAAACQPAGMADRAGRQPRLRLGAARRHGPPDQRALGRAPRGAQGGPQHRRGSRRARRDLHRRGDRRACRRGAGAARGALGGRARDPRRVPLHAEHGGAPRRRGADAEAALGVVELELHRRR